MTQLPRLDQESAEHEAEPATNSRDWWDQYFEETWEVNRGRNQTRGFMRVLIAHLPDNDLAYMLSNAVSVLDWGCAMGDGVRILGESFPQARVAGLDFSQRAIAAAREAYSQFTFVQTDDGSIPSRYDVIITSNCLEHFAHPIDIAQQHLASCNDLYIAMVPYNEQELLDVHQARFTDETFPDNIGEFVRITSLPIDVPDAYWPGQQLISVYGSPSYLQRRSLGAASLSLDLFRQIERLRTRLLATDAIVLGKQSAEAEEKVSNLWALAQEKDVALREKDGAIAELRHLHTTVVDALRDAERQATEECQRQQETSARIEQAMGEQLEQTRRELAVVNEELADLRAQLDFAHSTKAWRWSVKYWGWRQRASRAPS